ncbi:MAG TPA: cation transporter [Bacteroidales bacterium]|nr:cation transporter [Bacteroidales bacterium]
MKTIKIFLAVILSIAIGTSAFAQTAPKAQAVVKTEVFNVGGKCGMCKARIEKAAKVTGVSKAVWDTKTKKLTLVYEPSKVKTDVVLKAVAAVGHDADKFKATEKVYNSLPGCCKYR